MSRKVFVFKENGDDRDIVKYMEIENKPEDNFECGHYFSGLHTCGACFHGGFPKEVPEDITTILTKDEFVRLIEFNKAINLFNGLGSGIKEGDERYQKGIELYKSIQPILDKLLSEENEELFKQVQEEEVEYLKDEYGLDDLDIEQIFDEYYMPYRDRGVVGYVWKDVDDLAYEQAKSFGYVSDDMSDRYFNYDQFGEDLLEEDRYLELSDGRVVMLMS